MEFETIEPMQVRSKSVNMIDKIKLGFPTSNKGKIILSIQFGNAIAVKLGVKSGDKLSFAISRNSESVFALKKDDRGWAVCKVGSDSNPLYRIQVRWDRPVPESCKESYKFCSYDTYAGAMRIFLPDATEEDRRLL